MTRKMILSLLAVTALAVGGVYASGKLPPLPLLPGTKAAESQKKPTIEVPPIAVTVVDVRPAAFVESTLLTGTIVARDEILVGPEIDGVRVLELLADEGDRVAKGQPLARLTIDTLEAQLAQNDASLARTKAGIAQAQSNIVQAEARLAEAKSAFDRARPLRQSGAVSESVFEQREAAAKTAAAQLEASRDALRVAEAERAQVEALRREITWRRGNAEVKSPADGIVSRRSARVGAMASGVAEPMFRIIARGEVELEAEVPETHLPRIKPDQVARIAISGLPEVEGRVRLVSPEVDKATRLGRVRVFIGVRPELRVGAFARGTLETARSRGLAVPSSAVLYRADAAYVQLVVEGRVAARRVKVGLVTGAQTEIVEGLEDGDVVVAKSGTFLRDGDAVRPMRPERSGQDRTGAVRARSALAGTEPQE